MIFPDVCSFFLPEDSSYEDIMEEIYFIRKIEAGIKDLEKGKTHTHDEVKQRINQWLKYKYSGLTGPYMILKK